MASRATMIYVARPVSVLVRSGGPLDQDRTLIATTNQRRGAPAGYPPALAAAAAATAAATATATVAGWLCRRFHGCQGLAWSPTPTVLHRCFSHLYDATPVARGEAGCHR